jgi:uncharacterized protein YcsI (UPF0317 family)
VKPTTYTKVETLATEKAINNKVDVPIYRLYKSGKYTLDLPSERHSVHNTIAAPKEGA